MVKALCLSCAVDGKEVIELEADTEGRLPAPVPMPMPMPMTMVPFD